MKNMSAIETDALWCTGYEKRLKIDYSRDGQDDHRYVTNLAELHSYFITESFMISARLS